MVLSFALIGGIIPAALSHHRCLSASFLVSLTVSKPLLSLTYCRVGLPRLPMAEQGLAWLMPTIVMAVLAIVWDRMAGRQVTSSAH
ncbi:branched-chain amino acid transport system II carrier protein [Escherichia coli]